MSQQNIYPVQLLNDLHNYFPDILYNSGRFRNVQDLLDYIRSVADTSPFARGQAQYNNRQNSRVATGSMPAPSRQNSYPPVGPVQPPVTSGGGSAAASVGAPGAGGGFSHVYLNTFFDEPPVAPAPTATRIRVPLNGLGSNALMTTLLSGLFSDIMNPGVNMNNFFNERVPVYPSNEEIESATSRYNASRRQEDICAICQDDIEANQEMRRLNHCGHYFHRDCIDTWFQGNVHCPTCRHDIREGTVENQQPARTVENNNIRNRNLDNLQNIRNNETNQVNNTNPPPVPENHRRMNIRRPDNA